MASHDDTAETNLLLFTDSYKISHYKQYPPGLTYLKAYFESRGGQYENVVFFGLQYILKRFLSRPITMEMINEAELLLKSHFRGMNVFNRAGWEHILHVHGGHLPLRIRAVPEGSLVPTHNLLFSVESTDDRVPWLVNYVETCLLQVWYPLTVCSASHAQRQLIGHFLAKTADDQSALDFKLADFGFRGSTSLESAGLGGAAHLVNFRGSDTLAALTLARRYYGPKDLVAGFSVPATEHSTMSTWGRENESASLGHLLDKFPSGTLGVVSDTYDLWHYLEDVVGDEQYVDRIRSRKGKLVIRPDSGDPIKVVLKVLEILGIKFGTKVNDKGYKELPKFIRVIQGDGISYATIQLILEAMESAGWSADNLVFGSGGGLLQKLNRDTQKCAYKCCLAVVDGQAREVFKDPVTDPGKKSKKGDLTLVRSKEDGLYKTKRREEVQKGEIDQLVTVFENGHVVKEYTFEEVRKRLHEEMDMNRS